MASRICWNCELASHHTMHGEPIRSRITEARWMAAFKCDACSMLSVGQCDIPSPQTTPPRHSHGAQAKTASQLAKAEMNKHDAPMDWLPVAAIGRAFGDVPHPIADAASEAYSCHSIKSYRAAVLMARAVIEATAKHRGITKGTLAKKIDELHSKGMVRELVSRQAHEVRHLGNNMAHGDFVDPVKQEESNEVLGLMSEVLREVYQAPAQLQALEAKRKSATNATQQATT